jgi:hypothetical protein
MGVLCPLEIPRDGARGLTMIAQPGSSLEKMQLLLTF